jgi:hypothetical protein
MLAVPDMVEAELDTRAESEPLGLRPRLMALITAAALLLALPVTATARGESQPVTLGEWMRIIFVTPDREIDSSQKGTAIAPPPLPTQAVQTSSEPAPTREPIARAQIPRLWLTRKQEQARKHRRRQ